MKRRLLIFRIKLSIWIGNIADWVYPRSKGAILRDAQKIYPYAIILWSDDDIWINAFRVFIDRGLFNKNELARFKKKAELQRLSKARKEDKFIKDAKKEIEREINRAENG